MIPSNLVEIGESFEQKYQPVLDFEGWKVAMLRHHHEADPANLKEVERHTNTNEVFILTTGQADLIVCSGDDSAEDIHVIPMRLNVAYNIPTLVWHHALMSEGAHIILFERSETGPETTDYTSLTACQCAEIKSLASLCKA